MNNNIENDLKDGHTAGKDSVRYKFESRTAKTKRKAPKIIFIIIGLIVAISGAIIIFRSFANTAPSVGRINNWLKLDGATKLSIDMLPIIGDMGYHFYSLNSFFKGQNYGLYSGIQTNGNLGDGKDVGKIFIFRVWNAKSAKPENGAVATRFDGEGSGYSLRLRYDWKLYTRYKIDIYRLGREPVSNNWIWGSSITDLRTKKTTKIGEISATPQAEKLNGGSAFHERFQGTAPVCTERSSNLEKVGVRFSNISADVPSSFEGNSGRNNIFNYNPCIRYISNINTAINAYTGFGLSPLGLSNYYSFYEPKTPVYRHYSPSRGSHFFTTSKAESDKIRNEGWKFEGLAWDVSKNSNSIPVFRHYSPSRGRHFYTKNKAESDKIRNEGWKFEGIAWYSNPLSVKNPIYRHYSPSRRAHFYTRDKNESDKIKSQGWNFEGIEYYAF